MLSRTYLDLNKAYFQVMCLENAYKVLYLDLNEAIVSKMAHQLGSEYSNLDTKFILNAVRENIDLTMSKEAIGKFWSDSRVWATRRVDSDELMVPPTLLFLAVTGAAAREMGMEFNPNAYYLQFVRLLDLPSWSHKLIEDSFRYKKTYIELWDEVDSWLSSEYGLYGIPSHKPVGHLEYVGRAMSQAIIRVDDFRIIEKLFGESADLPTLENIEDVINVALSDSACKLSSSFRTFWKMRASSSAIDSVREYMVLAIQARLREEPNKSMHF